MDNIVIATIALRQRRQRVAKPDSRRPGWRSKQSARKVQHQAAFTRWIASLNPKFYVFYRVSGPAFKANPKVQVQLRLTPYFIANDTLLAHPIFADSFILYAYIERVIPYNDAWTLVDAVADHYPRQKINTFFPVQYFRYCEQILSKIPFPANIRSHSSSESAPTITRQSDLRFYRFRMRCRQAPRADQSTVCGAHQVANYHWNCRPYLRVSHSITHAPRKP